MNFRFQISDFGFEHALGLSAANLNSECRAEMSATCEQGKRRATKSEIRNQKSEIAP